jgi:5-methylcytosine-specific restriction endonuclease McrA
VTFHPSPLSKRSARSKAKAGARARCCAEVRRRAEGLCEAGPVLRDGTCAIAGEHVHEVRSRAQGGSITDPANAIFVCWSCHRTIHDQPRRSAELGLLYSKKWERA